MGDGVKLCWLSLKVAEKEAAQARDEGFYKRYASLAGAERDLFWLNTIIEEGVSFFKIWKCEHQTSDGVVWHTDYLLVSSFLSLFIFVCSRSNRNQSSVLPQRPKKTPNRFRAYLRELKW